MNNGNVERSFEPGLIKTLGKGQLTTKEKLVNGRIINKKGKMEKTTLTGNAKRAYVGSNLVAVGKMGVLTAVLPGKFVAKYLSSSAFDCPPLNRSSCRIR